MYVKREPSGETPGVLIERSSSIISGGASSSSHVNINPCSGFINAILSTTRFALGTVPPVRGVLTFLIVWSCKLYTSMVQRVTSSPPKQRPRKQIGVPSITRLTVENTISESLAHVEERTSVQSDKLRTLCTCCF